MPKSGGYESPGAAAAAAVSLISQGLAAELQPLLDVATRKLLCTLQHKCTTALQKSLSTQCSESHIAPTVAKSVFASGNRFFEAEFS